LAIKPVGDIFSDWSLQAQPQKEMFNFFDWFSIADELQFLD